MASNAPPTAHAADDRPEPGPRSGELGEDRVLASEASRSDREDQPGRHAAHGQVREVIAKRATYLALIGLFVGLFVAFSAREGRGRRGSRPPIAPFDVVLLAFSTFRLARIVSFDQVTEPIRAPVAESEPGGGTEPKGHGAQRALGELIACPLCLGVWFSALQTYGLLIAPKPTRVFTVIFGAAGIAEFLNYVVTLVDSANRLVQQRHKAATGS